MKPAAKTKRKPAAKKPRGRPSLYTPERAKEICVRLATGEPLTVICSDRGMPSDETVRRWQGAHPTFALDIAQARARGFDAIAWEALQIANTPIEGVETTTDEKGTSEKRGDMLGHRKLQIETRLKLLAKWDPKRYGEKVTQEHTGLDGGPIKAETVTMTAEEAYKRMLGG
jgi:hypothetical protein